MEDLNRLRVLYEQMDKRAQRELLALAERYAAQWPAPRAEPLLRLVASNAQN